MYVHRLLFLRVGVLANIHANVGNNVLAYTVVLRKVNISGLPTIVLSAMLRYVKETVYLSTIKTCDKLLVLRTIRNKKK